MEPVYGVIIFVIASAAVSLFAWSRQGTLAGVLYFIAIVALGIGLYHFTLYIAQGNQVMAGVFTFLAPISAILIILNTTYSVRGRR
ncbi:DUF2545 family protein [Entomohabitans teleogrylli]|uniref:DUF2545 family protein n=1 Tax=Entomohabitans teleogrylli TaxID=1384589 RepID=UPI00073D260D|nr:DUF2545 family protein [Entomohabitans teleogrylli]